MFSLGKIVQTAGVADSVNSLIVMACLRRHSRGDWGDLCVEDANENDKAIEYRDEEGLAARLFSVYDFDDFELWVITEWDESVTTILFPSEY